ncbi:MAG: hypothetical protein ACPGVO_14130 [Spirulinaceae cyanobacterium]
MMRLNWRKTGIALTVVVLIGTIATPSFAGRGNGRGNGQGNGRNPNVEVETVESSQLLTLTTSQRTWLINLVEGTGDDNDLLSEAIRLEITNLSPLPPGIQRKLARGGTLPPGIAKKVTLPRAIVSYLELPNDDVDIIVVGDNLAIVDSANTVIDLITGLF